MDEILFTSEAMEEEIICNNTNLNTAENAAESREEPYLDVCNDIKKEKETILLHSTENS